MKNKLTFLALLLLVLTSMSFAQPYYVNDNSTAGDVYTTAVGNDGNPGTAAAPFLTINHAISVASAGDVIYVDVGTYNEAVNVGIVITIIGAGSGPSETVITNPGGTAMALTVGTNTSTRVVVQDLRLTGSSTGIVVSSYNTLNNVVSISNTVYGISLNTLSDLIVNNSKFNLNGQGGLKLASTASASDISFTNCEFNGNIYGWYADANSGVEPILDNVTVTNTTFNDNLNKGLYTERLSNAIFNNITVNNSGTGGSLNHRAGIDINLKWRSDYTNIQIINSTISNSGTGDPNGGGILIKARSDGGTYGANPATLDNVVLSNLIISNNGGTGSYSSGIRIGEANNTLAGTNTSPTNVNINNCSFTGNSVYALSNVMLGTTVLAVNNWWGSANGPTHASNTFNVGSQGAMVTDNVTFVPWLNAAPPGGISFAPVTTTSPVGSFASIQAAVTSSNPGGIVNVAAGTYVETVVITKVLTMKGAQYGVDARTRSGSESIISSSDASGSIQISVTGTVNIDGFTVSGSPVKALQVTGVTTNVIVRNNIFNSATNDGINLFQAQNATVEYNWVKGAGTSGIVAGNDNGTPSELDGVITTALIRYNKVENSTYGITGYQTGSTISYNEVIGNTAVGAGIGGQFYSTSISNNIVHGYTNGAGIAFNTYVNRANSSNVTVNFNNVYGNSAGVYINQALAGSNIHVNRNQITGNTSYGAVFDVGGSGTLDAVYNWWGDLTGPLHSTNPSGTGNAVSDGVNFIPWLGSVTPQFTTYLLNPYDGAGLYGTTTTFSWYSGAPSIKYRLQVTLATDQYFYSPIISIVTTSTSYDAINSLFTPGTSYKWRVISLNSAETIVWNFSDTRNFNMPALPTPYLSYPTGSVTIYTNPPTLYWYLGTYYTGLTYVVKYWKDGQPDPGYPPAVAQTANGGSFHTASTNFFATLSATLTAGATYHWQVASTNDGGTTLSSWSAQGDFVVYSSTPATPPVPYLSWPVGGATSYINPPTFYWYLGMYSTGLEFYFEYDNDSGMGSPTGNSGWITNMYYSLPSSLASGTWYWHVKSRLTSSLVESSYSSTESFVIPASSSGSAPVPTPTYPIGGITIYTLSPTLSWYAYSASSLEYQIKYARYPDVDGSGVLNHSTVVTATWQSASTLPLSGLLAGATYYWQVRSRVAGTPGTESGWSYIVSFTTSPGASSVVPLLGSPNFGQPINSTTAVLSWMLPAQSQSHLQYDLQYSTKADFSNATTISDLDENQYQIKNLLPGEYYWKVLSKTNQGEKSNYSAVGDFKTGNVTDVTSEQAIPTQFELSQNYPNPFNPTTRITYTLPQNSFVTIRIYDMLGREIRTLLNVEKNAGTYSIDWNADDNLGLKVASGMYIYRITAGNFVATKKMVLIK